MDINIIKDTISKIATPGKGILAADESSNTIKKRFTSIGVESTEENRRNYREMLFTTPNLNKFISGIILFEETLYQKTSDNKAFPSFMLEQNMIPGIKVDKGLVPSINFPEYKITEGLDGLYDRLKEYIKQGIKFAKWRAVFPVTKNNNFNINVAIKTNAELLARYAVICQDLNIVPIVEPEVLMDTDHSIEDCAIISRQVFSEVFNSLSDQQVVLDAMILKPNMIVSGLKHSKQASEIEVATKTLAVLRDTVPASVPAIMFLSGGQDSRTATVNLNSINSSPSTMRPWYLSFSYGRALQDDALKTWSGKSENITKAQQMLYKRAEENSLATMGKYQTK